MTDIEIFIKKLEGSSNFLNSVNLYDESSNLSLIRKSNLKLYLEDMKDNNPKILLLGEAPGYKGCLKTGIAFTSERVILSNDFFKYKNYQIESKNNLESEISATIVWDEISKFKEKILLWNIFPFHPYKKDNYMSNRTPSLGELSFGKLILIELLKIFKIELIVAIGRKAESHIKDLGINYVYARHPANGGKNKFIEDLKLIELTKI